jgi:hypothetical protein
MIRTTGEGYLHLRCPAENGPHAERPHEVGRESVQAGQVRGRWILLQMCSDLLGAIKHMNLTAIQTWAIVVQTAVFFSQTVVLGKTLATVAEQTSAAKAQKEAAENQANMAIKQLYANIAQADNAVRPLVNISGGLPDATHMMYFKIQNDGLGPALNIRAYLDERAFVEKTLPRIPVPLPISFLGVGQEAQLTVREQKLALQNLVIEYASTMNSTYETRYAFGDDGEYHQTERLREQPYEALADEQFRSLFSRNG